MQVLQSPPGYSLLCTGPLELCHLICLTKKYLYTTMITDKMKQMTTMYDDDQRSGWELLDFFIHFLEKNMQART